MQCSSHSNFTKLSRNLNGVKYSEIPPVLMLPYEVTPMWLYILCVQMKTSANYTALQKTLTSSSPCPARSKMALPVLTMREMSVLMECVRYSAFFSIDTGRKKFHEVIFLHDLT